MTENEFEQLKSTIKQWLFHTGSLDPTDYANELKLKFIEPKENKIADLEKQIEKMKGCFNCKYRNEFVESKCGECECHYSKWEIKEQ